MIQDKLLRELDRRTFMKILGITGVTGLAYPKNLLASLHPFLLSRVVIVSDDTAASGQNIISGTAQIMVDSGIKALAGSNSISDAWKTLLPGIEPSKKIAIKVNCINSSMSTHPIVTYCVVNSLKKMSFTNTPFPENNIIIFDRTTSELRSSGYTINKGTTGVRCFSTGDVGYYSTNFNINNSSQKLSKILVEMVDYLINISVMKNHNISGVTLCMKNHYGTCDNPGGLHGSNCDPYIPALNALPPIREKQKVNICDAIFGIKSGGPDGSPQFLAKKLLFSQDVVAIDYWGRKILKDNGCGTISAAHHIETADTKYGLGTADPTKMDVINLNNPTASVQPEPNEEVPADFVLLQNYPNPFNSQTQIQFYLAQQENVHLHILDLNGREVRKLIQRALPMGWHQFFWDGRNDRGLAVSSGIYLGQLRTENFQQAIIMNLIK
jgi:uncharacterized protein (DUF362 family)